jgi:hypothetical protein
MEEEMNNQNSEQEVDVEVMEFSLDGDEIDELVAKLQLLKATKEPFSFQVDDENEFQISFEEDSETEGDD